MPVPLRGCGTRGGLIPERAFLPSYGEGAVVASRTCIRRPADYRRARGSCPVARRLSRRPLVQSARVDPVHRGTGPAVVVRGCLLSDGTWHVGSLGPSAQTGCHRRLPSLTKSDVRGGHADSVGLGAGVLVALTRGLCDRRDDCVPPPCRVRRGALAGAHLRRQLGTL